MSETAEHNGTATAAEDQPCEDCEGQSSKWLGIVVIGLAVFVAVMGLDMLTGGRLGGVVRERYSPQ